MIIGTGIDIIDVERVAERVGRNSGFRELVFSAGEIAYCESKAAPFEHFAARFAAKEAFLKAIGSGWETGLQLNQVEIVNDAKGKPELRLTGGNGKYRASAQDRENTCLAQSFKNLCNGHRYPGIMTTFDKPVFPGATQIIKSQNEKLLTQLAYLSGHSPFYQRMFSEKKIDISQIKTVEDLALLPVTGKEDLQAFNDDFLCVPRNKVVEYTSTSGTLGSPVTIALTENDLQRLSLNEEGSFLCADGSAADCYQLMLTLDRQFMAGMAYYSGIRRMGAGIIRVGPGVPSLQWETIFRLKPTAIVAVPSFIFKLIGYAREHGIDISKTSVTKAICIGENIRHPDFTPNVLSERIRDAWDIRLYSTYASTEMQTAFTECGAGKGGHLQPELLIVELLDDRDRPVKPGAPGEVTVTTLGVEGMPLLRYKTGDICIAHGEPCACGRHSLRLSPVIGRKKQMIKFKGTTLFAPALYDLLNGLEDVGDFVAEVHSNEIGTDEVLLHLFVADPTAEADHRIRSNLQARLRVTPAIRYVSAEDLQRLQFPGDGRKPLRFIDNRTPPGVTDF